MTDGDLFLNVINFLRDEIFVFDQDSFLFILL